MNNRRERNNIADRERRNIIHKRKRTIQLRNRILVSLAVTLMMILCFATTLFVSNAKARNTSEDAVLYKYYKSVQIQNDDTLWELAKENYSAEKQTISEYIHEVKCINHLENDTITVGYYIVLPYYSSEFVYY